MAKDSSVRPIFVLLCLFSHSTFAIYPQIVPSSSSSFFYCYFHSVTLKIKDFKYIGWECIDGVIYLFNLKGYHSTFVHNSTNNELYQANRRNTTPSFPRSNVHTNTPITDSHSQLFIVIFVEILLHFQTQTRYGPNWLWLKPSMLL